MSRSRSDWRDRLVDDELHLKRRDEGGDLQSRRQHQHLGRAPARSPSAVDQSMRELHRRAGADRLEVSLGDLEHDAGEVLGEFVQRQRAHAEGRIVQITRLAADRS